MGDETDLTAEEFATWVRVPDALKLFHEVSWEGRIRALSTRIKTGLLRSAAETAIFRSRSDKPNYFELVPDNWMHWSPEEDDHFWETGDTNMPIATSDQIISVGHQFFGIRLDPDGLKRMDLLPVIRTSGAMPLPTPPPPVPFRNAGGRPPKPFWEDMLVAMLAKHHETGIQASSQADVQRAIADWLAMNGHEAGDTQIKERARKIWQAIKP